MRNSSQGNSSDDNNNDHWLDIQKIYSTPKAGAEGIFKKSGSPELLRDGTRSPNMGSFTREAANASHEENLKNFKKSRL